MPLFLCHKSVVVIVIVIVGTLLGAGGMFFDPKSTAYKPSGRGSVAIAQVRGLNTER